MHQHSKLGDNLGIISPLLIIFAQIHFHYMLMAKPNLRLGQNLLIITILESKHPLPNDFGVT